VIGELAHFAPGTKGLYARLKEKADLEYRIPRSLRTHVAEETIRGWLREYRKGGFDAPARVRKDQRRSHACRRRLGSLVSIKDEKPDLSVHPSSARHRHEQV
jgi:hypothetical protein